MCGRVEDEVRLVLVAGRVSSRRRTGATGIRSKGPIRRRLWSRRCAGAVTSSVSGRWVGRTELFDFGALGSRKCEASTYVGGCCRDCDGRGRSAESFEDQCGQTASCTSCSPCLPDRWPKTTRGSTSTGLHAWWPLSNVFRSPPLKTPPPLSRDAVAADCGSVASTRLMCSRSRTQSRTHRSPTALPASWPRRLGPPACRGAVRRSPSASSPPGPAAHYPRNSQRRMTSSRGFAPAISHVPTGQLVCKLQTHGLTQFGLADPLELTLPVQ